MIVRFLTLTSYIRAAPIIGEAKYSQVAVQTLPFFKSPEQIDRLYLGKVKFPCRHKRATLVKCELLKHN